MLLTSASDATSSRGNRHLLHCWLGTQVRDTWIAAAVVLLAAITVYYLLEPLNSFKIWYTFDPTDKVTTSRRPPEICPQQTEVTAPLIWRGIPCITFRPREGTKAAVEPSPIRKPETAATA